LLIDEVNGSLEDEGGLGPAHSLVKEMAEKIWGGCGMEMYICAKLEKMLDASELLGDVNIKRTMLPVSRRNDNSLGERGITVIFKGSGRLYK